MTLKRFRLDRALPILTPEAQGAKWNKIFVAGEFHRDDFPGGKLSIGRAEFEQMISNWKRAGGQGLPIDRFHWGDSNDTRIAAQDKKAVGFIEDLRISPEGDLEGLTNWNAEGRDDILNDRLRYFSPSFAPNLKDSKTGKPQGFTLFGGGLLNDPFLTDLPRMAATASPSTPNHEAPKAKEKHMDKKLICALFGLPEDTTDEALNEHMKKCATSHAEASKLAAAHANEKLELSKRADSNGEALKMAQAQAVKLADEVTALKAAKVAGEVTALEEQLIAERRINAAQRADVKAFAAIQGVEKTREFFSKMPLQGTEPKEVGIAGPAEVPATDKAKLQLAYEAEISKLTLSGVKVSDASKQVRREHPEFKPLFAN